MLHELVLMMAINIQSHVKKSMIITEYLLDHSIPRYNTNTVKSTIIQFYSLISYTKHVPEALLEDNMRRAG
jgi:hypothetical protein